MGLGPDSDLSISSLTLTRGFSSLSCWDRDQLLFRVKSEMAESEKRLSTSAFSAGYLSLGEA